MNSLDYKEFIFNCVLFGYLLSKKKLFILEKFKIVGLYIPSPAEEIRACKLSQPNFNECYPSSKDRRFC